MCTFKICIPLFSINIRVFRSSIGRNGTDNPHAFYNYDSPDGQCDGGPVEWITILYLALFGITTGTSTISLEIATRGRIPKIFLISFSCSYPSLPGFCVQALVFPSNDGNRGVRGAGRLGRPTLVVSEPKELPCVHYADYHSHICVSFIKCQCAISARG